MTPRQRTIESATAWLAAQCPNADAGEIREGARRIANVVLALRTPGVTLGPTTEDQPRATNV